MTTNRIIQAIKATKSLDGTLIAIAAYLADTHPDCRKNVQEWWKRQGGTVDDETEVAKREPVRFTTKGIPW